jgi:hypothetical protein
VQPVEFWSCLEEYRQLDIINMALSPDDSRYPSWNKGTPQMPTLRFQRSGSSEEGVLLAPTSGHWCAPGDPASARRVTQRTPAMRSILNCGQLGLVHRVLDRCPPTLLSLLTLLAGRCPPCSPRLMLLLYRNRSYVLSYFPALLSSQMSAAQVCLRESGMWILELECPSQVIGLYSLCFRSRICHQFVW